MLIGNKWYCMCATILCTFCEAGWMISMMWWVAKDFLKKKDISTLVGAQLCNFLYTSLNKRIKVPFLVILSKWMWNLNIWMKDAALSNCVKYFSERFASNISFKDFWINYLWICNPISFWYKVQSRKRRRWQNFYTPQIWMSLLLV